MFYSKCFVCVDDIKVRYINEVINLKTKRLLVGSELAFHDHNPRTATFL